ncbi:MAG: bifunctional adenosylcobinamide kinase/adenosylcobinamide-phosphate guanylyltransferase [Acidibrevibacterium sp.]|uniref:bifunctional adenosylcobinamide kinase/adenosylcobinamide-phosphate guanylyltransferase n=1 Tax=Acidibrevibacterium sp. TaxID=2606776 RepID=UPI003D047808
MARMTLILGGARSGKSAEGERLIARHPGPLAYIATAEAGDAEMAARIASHRARRGPRWRTIEAPIALAAAISDAAPLPTLVDCLTLWLSNLMLAGNDIALAAAALEEALFAHPAPIALVANEVGLGIVPDNALARRFRDEAGALNQRLAARADRVLMMVAGYPIEVKRP